MNENERLGFYWVKFIFNKKDEEIKTINKFLVKCIDSDDFGNKIYYPALKSIIKNNETEFYNYDDYKVRIWLNGKRIFWERVSIDNHNKEHFFSRLEKGLEPDDEPIIHKMDICC